MIGGDRCCLVQSGPGYAVAARAVALNTSFADELPEDRADGLVPRRDAFADLALRERRIGFGAAPTTDGRESLATDTSGIVDPSRRCVDEAVSRFCQGNRLY